MRINCPPGGPVIDFAKPMLRNTERSGGNLKPDWIQYHRDEKHWFALTVYKGIVFSSLGYQIRKSAAMTSWDGILYPIARWSHPISGPENPGA